MAKRARGELRKQRSKRELQLRPRASVSELGAAAIGAARSAFLEHARGGFAGAKPEPVHQARVALRKLRVYARLFRSRIGAKRAAHLSGELRWLFGVLGTLRDLQVFSATHLSPTHPPSAAARGLRTRLLGRTTLARQDLRSAALSPRFRELCALLEAVEQDLRTQRRDGRRARDWLARRLSRQLEGVLPLASSATRAGPQLHRLRKRLKKLRYTADLLRALDTRHAQRTQRFRLALVATQDVLGAWNDLRAAQTLLKTLAPARAREARLAEPLAASAAAHFADLSGALACLLAAKPFWP